MSPAPNDTDWQVGKARHREMVAIGQHQQFIACALALSATRDRRVSLRRQLTTALAPAKPRFVAALERAADRWKTGPASLDGRPI